MSTAKQRIIVLAGLVALLIAAPILNYAFNSSKNKNTSSATTNNKPAATAAAALQTASVMTGNFFSDYVSERDKTRTDEVQYLDSIINDKNTDAATLKTAQQQKADIALAMEKELAIESLLKAKGFDKVAAVYQPGSVNIIVGKSQLTDAEVAQILDIAKTETGEKAENIKIIPVQ
jgi:stage III sporulation protein AH